MDACDLEAIFQSLSDQSLIDNRSAFENIKHIDAINGAVKSITDMDYESLYFLFVYKLEQAIDGIIEEVTPSHDAKLIFKHSHFLEIHLSELFEKYEGAACCSDKASRIIKGVLCFYMTGKKIEFDYNAEFTYHLPKTMLKDHDSIVLFVKALIGLYYGNVDRYLAALLTVLPKSEN